jgi:hypothetical protein
MNQTAVVGEHNVRSDYAVAIVVNDSDRIAVQVGHRNG